MTGIGTVRQMNYRVSRSPKLRNSWRDDGNQSHDPVRGKTSMIRRKIKKRERIEGESRSNAHSMACFPFRTYCRTHIRNRLMESRLAEVGRSHELILSRRIAKIAAGASADFTPFRTQSVSTEGLLFHAH